MRTARTIAPLVENCLRGLVAGPAAVPVEGAPVIGTHDGSFHCDEAMACGLLRATAKFAKASVARTRAPDVIAKCDIVVDVGAVYDAAAHRYDHHQKEFQGTMDTGVRQYKTRLSSAGLVYKHFGNEILETYVAQCVAAGRLERAPSEQDMRVLYDRVYKGFVEHVDGIDNGVEQFALAPGAPEGAELAKNYSVGTTLSERVKDLFPRWNEPQSREAEDAAFCEAVKLTLTEFLEAVDYYACSWLPARGVVASAFAKAAEIHPSKQIAVIENGGCPWKEHLLDLEKEAGVEGQTLYVLFPDPKGAWRIQCVPKGNSSFQNRKSLPWRGLRDDALSDASGVPGGVFVHVSGFIGGNKTYEGALAMALKALEMPDEEAGKRGRDE